MLFRSRAHGTRLDAGVPLSARLPSLCAVCRSWGRRGVCAACLDRFAAPILRCQRCALHVPSGMPVCGTCLVDPAPFDAAIACFDYRAPWDRLITAFKFHGAVELAPFFAGMLEDAQRRSGALLPDIVVPVPLAAGRLRERGYNQAWLLARRVARRLKVASDAELLLQLRETAHQLDLPPASRAGNVRDAFAVEPRRRAEIAGRRIAVVDDVLTTGSTASEIARVLQQAGAAHVDIWVLARTPRRDDA